jgi:hypothetical protein
MSHAFWRAARATPQAKGFAGTIDFQGYESSITICVYSTCKRKYYPEQFIDFIGAA